MQHINIITRRGFIDRSIKIGLAAALATLTDIPLVVKQALAEGNIGLNGKKLLFIFLRGGMDSLNTVIPIMDSAYDTDINPATPGLKYRNGIAIQKDAIDYSQIGACDFPISSSDSANLSYNTFSYTKAIRLGNGFAALHPSLKFMAPVYNAGDLAIIHRVGYPKQSRSHFDSQIYWENGSPNNNISKDGIFYRTIMESGLAQTNALSGVSIQSALPLILRGSDAAMTNLSDPTRYNLLGVPNDTQGNNRADAALRAANSFPFPHKNYRDLLALQYRNLSDTLKVFETMDFAEDPANGKPGNYYVDDAATDGDTGPYYLFPTRNDKNGGARYHNDAQGNPDSNKYVVSNGSYSFFKNLKAAALVLNKTDAIIAGTELGSFDTHTTQGDFTGALANLQRSMAWAMYGLKKYFTNYSDKTNWNDVVVVTLSEFGRTTIVNSDAGTDHAEAGAMFVAGGSVNSGVYGCGLNDSIPWITGPPNQGNGVDGSMFGIKISNKGVYLKRTTDYRSILGRIIRNHLGATQNQLNRIIPGYANPAESLLSGGTALDGTPIVGEIGII